MRHVVSNAGPLVHLSEGDALRLLKLTGQMSVPPQVMRESANCLSQQHVPEWIAVVPLNEPRAAESLAWQQAGLLDVGEADALALARQLNADWFLTDDERARLPGKQLGLEVHGSLGVVLWMAAVRLIERKEAEEAIERLANSSLWVSAAVLNVMPGDSRCGMASDRIRRLTMQCKPAEPVLSEAEGRVSRLCSRSFQRMTFARAKMKHRCLKKHSLDYP